MISPEGRVLILPEGRKAYIAEKSCNICHILPRKSCNICYIFRFLITRNCSYSAKNIIQNSYTIKKMISKGF